METIYIVAGGTGGHINAALSLGETFKKDFHVKYLTGTRYLDYQLFKAHDAIHLESKPLRTKNIFRFALNIYFNILVLLKILVLFWKTKPLFVLGAGGYICGPTLSAAKILLKPIFILEQNAIAGVTNKILSQIANIVFTNFSDTKGINKANGRVVVAGNPIRSNISSLEEKKVHQSLNVFVFGGSLGASQINEAIEILITHEFENDISILHQVGKSTIKHDITTISKNVNYEQKEYIVDMHKAYEWADIIVARAGASTVSELRVVKKPAILIPYPQATDNHQYFNAVELKKENGFFVEIIDKSLKGDALSLRIQESIKNIESKNLYYKNDVEITDASILIKKEIMNYVWNK